MSVSQRAPNLDWTQCVYCLTPTATEDLTKDHIFARALYPSTTPPNTQKWQVAACTDCNNGFSRVEDEVRLLLGMRVDPKSEAAAGFVDAVMRSIHPDVAKSPADAQARLRKRLRILRETLSIDSPDQPGVPPR